MLFPTPGDAIAALVIVAFWLTLAYFVITSERDRGDDQ